MRGIVYDFETTHRNPVLAFPIKWSYAFFDESLLSEGYPAIYFAKEINVRFNKSWDSLTKGEIEALQFNGINNSLDLIEHNSKAIPVETAIRNFLKHLERHNSNFEVLMGYNNETFDNPILDSIFEKYHGNKFSKLFVFQTLDIYQKVLNISKNIGFELPSGDRIYSKPIKFTNSEHFWNKYTLKDSSGNIIDSNYKHALKLDRLHPSIFGNMNLKFHASPLDDLKATFQLYRYAKGLNGDGFVEVVSKTCVLCSDEISILSNPLQSTCGGYVCEKVSCMKLAYETLREKKGLSVPEKTARN